MDQNVNSRKMGKLCLVDRVEIVSRTLVGEFVSFWDTNEQHILKRLALQYVSVLRTHLRIIAKNEFVGRPNFHSLKKSCFFFLTKLADNYQQSQNTQHYCCTQKRAKYDLGPEPNH